ncbi:ATP-GRASP peptide maturase, grasp-with-spasm system [Chryseobacterium nakagawai]|uniref:Grasp-with-spasm system ATP-grasp peptide maturase n=1 Tax=Chryseobacterium nakagawai TaxID=1241982 RepID=A0AAD0YP38_CHRNA|nr:grasp-with-spasm system ATP-grasp peptide maturase [Chryseobacterium nakagawai]AZA92515.1 grasp-with-spasm system ATP-grasp peptide maturase [Chryseobacterium nakagawai]VEH19094.1 ATP-GRASP peptide maturase, grasp-with-spasm system [Chryseobacterium nakagawai]
MILIISQNNEITTTEVIRYLVIMKKKFIRINEDEIFEIRTQKKRIFLQSLNNHFFLDEINSVWYRRGRLNFKRLKYTNVSINLDMNETQHWLEDYVRMTLESKKHINKESTCHINKLIVLEKAKELGFEVPEYFLAENTDEVEINQMIVKTIGGNVILDEIKKDSGGFMYTSIVEKHEKNDFFITFFQEKIEKDFEIRTFYLDGKCWSMAIFSQNDKQTEIDFRKYNNKKPNRNVPYQLPKSIEEKIHLLMQFLDLNCGSIDFIKKENKFYFLEINPIGQFLGLSNTCNYQLERKIAEYL